MGTLVDKLKALLSLSRTYQASLSMSQPVLGALLGLKGIPSTKVIVIGFIASWTGNHAAFAINDYMDMEVDKKRLNYLKKDNKFDIDRAFIAYPLAQGYITEDMALIWILSLFTIATIFAYLLNPISAILYIVAIILEILYCRLLMVSPLKVVISGAMVSFGVLAGWFATSNSFNPDAILILFIWIFFWEIGGRNIPNDMLDVEEDKLLNIKTVPLIYGMKFTKIVIFTSAILTSGLSVAIAYPLGLNRIYIIGAVILSIYFLIIPAIKLFFNSDKLEEARIVFNKGSFYPLFILIALVLSFYYDI
jgi:4-hydroxybenzoate polyprenyltransferase